MKIIEGQKTVPMIAHFSLLIAMSILVTWWTIGMLMLTNILPFISTFPTLWLELSPLPLPYLTYSLIHSSPIL